MRYGSLMMLLTGFAFCVGCQAPFRSRSPSDAPTGPALEPWAPKAGQAAPLFKLKTLDRKREVDLAHFAGDRPVLLMFGSYT